MPRITITAADGFESGAYLASPRSRPLGGVVVVQEIFGVNAHIRRVTDSYAYAGYIAVAPQIFDRLDRDVELGYRQQSDWDRGMELAFRRYDRQTGMLDLTAAVQRVAPYGKVGLVGYCFGGLLAWLSACEISGLSAVSSYYGGGIVHELHRAPRCPVIMHVGDQDGGIPMSEVEAIRAAKPEVRMYTYPGAGHGFNCDEREGYHPEAAALARARTLAFFANQLG